MYFSGSWYGGLSNFFIGGDMSATLELTSEQKAKIQSVVGHDLDIVKKDLGNVGSVTLELTDSQKQILQKETGKALATIELTEQDLKKYSSIACYERGGIVLT
jgi:hypothetical protein